MGGVLNITTTAWTAEFHWWRSGNITRTQNVSEYMLVLAVCLVVFARGSVAAEQCPQFTLARDRRYSQFVSKPVYEHVTSSFTLDQDARCVPDAGAITQSASDYRRCAAGESCRPRSPARPRPPASIFHEDERNLDDVTSEQLRHYRRHPTQSRAAEDYYQKYRATTYKRHADPRFKVRARRSTNGDRSLLDIDREFEFCDFFHF